MHFNRWRISHCGTRKSQQVWPFRHGCISHAWSWQTKSKRWPYPNWTLLYVMLRETWRKCIGNCTTGNVPCKQCRTTWSRGSCSCPLLHQFWERQNYGTTQGTTEEMLETLEMKKTTLYNTRKKDHLMDRSAAKLPLFKRDWHDLLFLPIRYLIHRLFHLFQLEVQL